MASEAESSCTRYSPGHKAHPIQGRLSSEGNWTKIQLLTSHGLEIVVAVDDGVETWRFHDHPLSHRVLERWRPDEPAMISQYGLLLTASGILCPCRDLAKWQECS